MLQIACTVRGRPIDLLIIMIKKRACTYIWNARTYAHINTVWYCIPRRSHFASKYTPHPPPPTQSERERWIQKGFRNSTNVTKQKPFVVKQTKSVQLLWRMLRRYLLLFVLPLITTPTYIHKERGKEKQCIDGQTDPDIKLHLFWFYRWGGH